MNLIKIIGKLLSALISPKKTGAGSKPQAYQKKDGRYR